MENNILDDQIITPISIRRRNLLPLWIKIFLWFFMITGFLVPLGLIFGLFGIPFNISLYGFDTTEPLSLIGISLSALFLIKGVTAFGLWTEKDWAVKLALADAVIGIAVCIFAMLILPFITLENGYHLNIRLELLALIPYFIKMRKINAEWDNRKTTHNIIL